MRSPSRYFVTIISILVITIVWFAGKPKDLRNDLWRFKMFVECKGELEAYVDKEMHLNISKIKSHIAANDTLYRLETENTGHYEDYKFYLYPVRLLDVPKESCAETSTLLVNLKDVDSHSDFLNRYANRLEIDEEHVLFSNETFPTIVAPSTSPIKSIFLFVTAQVFLFAIGYLSLLFLIIKPSLKTLLAPLLGYVILNVVSILSLLLVGKLTPFLTVGLLLFGSVSFAVYNRSLVQLQLLELKRVFVNLLDVRKWRPLESVSGWMVMLTLVSFGICLLHILFRPIWAGDALAFWMMKANIIFNDGLNFSWGLQNEYPIFWSQFFAVFYGLNGSINQLLSKWYVVVELLLVYGFIWEFSVGLSKRTRIFFMFIFFPLFGYHWLYSLFAETIVVLFSFGFVRITMLHLEERINLRSYIVFGSILMIGVSYSKLEGVFQILMILLPFLLVYKRIKSVVFVYFIGLTLLIMVSLLAWKGFVVDNGWHVSEHAVETPGFGKVLLIIDKLFSILGNMSFFTFAIGVVFIQFILTKNPSRTSQALLLGVILIWLFSGFSLIGWDTQRIVDYAWTAMPRLIWHATPLIILLSIQLIKDSSNTQIKARV